MKGWFKKSDGALIMTSHWKTMIFHDATQCQFYFMFKCQNTLEVFCSSSLLCAETPGLNIQGVSRWRKEPSNSSKPTNPNQKKLRYDGK